MCTDATAVNWLGPGFVPIRSCTVQNGGDLNCFPLTDGSCDHSMDLGVVCCTYEQLCNENCCSTTDPTPTCPTCEVTTCPTTNCIEHPTVTTESCDCPIYKEPLTSEPCDCTTCADKNCQITNYSIHSGMTSICRI